MSAGAIKAQGLLLLLHRYRWILPSICIHHGWHVFHGGTAVTGVRQSSIIPGLTVPNLLYCPSSSLRQKFLFLPPPISTKRSKTYSRVFYIVVCASTRFKIIKKIVEDHVSFTLVTILKKKKKNPHYKFPKKPWFHPAIIQWCHRPLDLAQTLYASLRVRIFTLQILTFMIIPRMRGTRKESVLQNSKISE